LDTVDEYNEANSWCSPSQANTKAGGKFTGITTFQSHIICFKHDFMHEIYNTKNPFRLQDIYAEGTIDNRTIQDVDGKLIFVSADGVKIYTGSNPRVIDYNLNMTKYTEAVSGTDNRNYYLYCVDADYVKHLYVYDTLTELWSEQSIDKGVISFAHNKNGMYMLCDDGHIYKMDTNNYNHKWSFETELITNQTVDIKHIKKLQMLVELNTNANMQVYILYDNEVFNKNTSHLVYSSDKSGRFPIRVKPRNTANYGFKLHFEGYGYAKLYELEIFVEAGGDMYV
jgi:outer membrane protein assembly factor BamB